MQFRNKFNLLISICFQGRKAQEPILTSGHSTLNASVNMIVAAKSLSLNPRDPPAWQQLASNSKDVSDSIKSLITNIRLVNASVITIIIIFLNNFVLICPIKKRLIGTTI